MNTVTKSCNRVDFKTRSCKRGLREHVRARSNELERARQRVSEIERRASGRVIERAREQSRPQSPRYPCPAVERENLKACVSVGVYI